MTIESIDQERGLDIAGLLPGHQTIVRSIQGSFLKQHHMRAYPLRVAFRGEWHGAPGTPQQYSVDIRIGVEGQDCTREEAVTDSPLSILILGLPRLLEDHHKLYPRPRTIREWR